VFCKLLFHITLSCTATGCDTVTADITCWSRGDFRKQY